MLSFIIAFMFVIIATPLVKKLAFAFDIVDRPNRASKVHKAPIPLMGGLGVFLIVVTNSLLFSDFSFQNIGIALGGIIIAAIGILDDVYSLSYKLRLGIQVGLAGLMVTYFDLYFFGAGLEWLFVPLSIVWIVGLTNSLNFIDNMDGSSSGVACISAIGLAAIGYFTGNMAVFILATSLAGAALGFLVFNFKPASIFLGDMGSMFFGFTLATTTLLLSQSITLNLANFFIFPFLLGLPIFDTCLVMWIRISNGLPVYHADRNHVTFQFVNLGFSQKNAVIMEYVVAAFFTIAGFVFFLIPFSISWVIIFSTSILTAFTLAKYFITHKSIFVLPVFQNPLRLPNLMTLLFRLLKI